MAVREGVRNVLITSLLLALQSTQAGSEPPSDPPPACESEAHAAFDFWVGEWDVYPTGGDEKIADSRIERVASGCVIRETWMPLRGGDGASHSIVNHRSGRWEQVWTGSDGTRVDFVGGPVDGAMILTGYWDGIGANGEDVLVRMTYTRAEDGSVRQLGEASRDHGRTWQASFDLTYRDSKDTTG